MHRSDQVRSSGSNASTGKQYQKTCFLFFFVLQCGMADMMMVEPFVHLYSDFK